MGKWVANAVLDEALQVISGADRMVAVGGQPQDFSTAWNGRLAEVALTSADFLVMDGNVSGRRVEVGGKAEVPVVAEGTADHVALLDSLAGKLLYVTTCPAQSLTPGGTVSFDPWGVEIGAPA